MPHGNIPSQPNLHIHVLGVTLHSPFDVVLTVYVWLFFAPFCVISTAMYIQRRDIHPLQARYTFLNVSIAFFNLLQSILYWLRTLVLTDPGCVMPLFSNVFLITVQPALYILRVVMLYIRFTLADAKLKQTSVNPWVKKASALVSNPRLRYILFIGFPVFVLSPILLVLPFPALYDEDEDGICDLKVSDYFYLITMSVWVSLGLYLRKQLSDAYDWFGLKKELGTIAFAALFTVVLFVVGQTAVPHNVKYYYFHPGVCFGLMFFAVSQVLTILLPLLESRKDYHKLSPAATSAVEQVSSENVENTIGTGYDAMMERILSDDEAFECLMEQLIGEFCSETGIFLRRVREYKRLAVPNEAQGNDFLRRLCAEALQIYFGFIVFGSALQVNLPFSDVKSIKATLADIINTEKFTTDSLPPENNTETEEVEDKIRALTVIYDESYRTIKDLIRSGPWMRFSRSDRYPLLVEKLEMKKAFHQVGLMN